MLGGMQRQSQELYRTTALCAVHRTGLKYSRPCSCPSYSCSQVTALAQQRFEGISDLLSLPGGLGAGLGGQGGLGSATQGLLSAFNKGTTRKA